jgi:hypothetical protein
VDQVLQSESIDQGLVNKHLVFYRVPHNLLDLKYEFQLTSAYKSKVFMRHAAEIDE